MYKVLVTTTASLEIPGAAATCSVHSLVVEFATPGAAKEAMAQVNDQKVNEMNTGFQQYALPLYRD